MTHRAVFLLAASLVCCGWATAKAEEAAAPARFHHVLINATKPEQSIRYYRRVFGAVPVKFRGVADALFCERSFILFNPVSEPPDATLNTGLWHIGWGGVDVQHEYEWWKSRGVDFHTPPSPLPGRDNFYMYLLGPDKELIEINTMGHHRFAHVHFFVDDLNATVGWYARHLGLRPRTLEVPKPKGSMDTLAGIWMNTIQCDNVTLIFFGKPDQDPPPPWWPDKPLTSLASTKGRPIERIGFSYRQLEPEFERMKAAGVTVVDPLSLRPQFGMKSFVVEAPDGVLIELVEAKPIPEGVWE